MKIYNKLVRDKIPEIIEKNGLKAEIEILDDRKFEESLKEKLKEEIEEYFESNEIEKLADIYEVLEAILELKGLSYEKIFEMKNKKNREKGSFKKRFFLKETKNPNALKMSKSDLEAAIMDRDTNTYVNLNDGSFRWIFQFDSSEEEKDEVEDGNFMWIRPMDSGEAFKLMRDFIYEEVAEEIIYNKLNNALKGSKPFRRFKDEISKYPELEYKWYKYEEEKNLEYAVEQFENQEIDIELI